MKNEDIRSFYKAESKHGEGVIVFGQLLRLSSGLSYIISLDCDNISNKNHFTEIKNGTEKEFTGCQDDKGNAIFEGDTIVKGGMKYKIRYDESTNSLVASYIGSESYFKSIVSILVDGAIKQNNENIDSELIYKLIKNYFKQL